MPQTKLIDRQLYEKRNVDDIFTRNVIGGLLKVLNNTLSYNQIWDDTKGQVEEVTIPFYYDIGNPLGERFLQDNYLTFGDQCGFKKINGNFDMIPRGTISIESSQIQADAITNRMVMGEYQKEDPSDGKIKTYVAYMYSIPITMNVSVMIYTSSFNETLKIEQACREYFYKNKTYYITYKGMKLGCRVGFPESFLGEKMSGYTMGTDADKYFQKISFELVIECYHPVFDPTTEMLKSNVIRSFSTGTTLATSADDIKKKNKYYGNLYNTLVNETNDAPYTYSGDFRLINKGNEALPKDSKDTIYVIDKFGNYPLFPSGATMNIRWNWRKSDGDLDKVFIKWQDMDKSDIIDHDFNVVDNNAELIETIQNHQEYQWNIPEDFTDFKGTDIAILNTDIVTVYKNPILKAVPDPSTGCITQDTIFCLDPGYFMCSAKDDEWDRKDRHRDHIDYYTHVDAELSYEDRDGNIQSISLNIPIKNSKVETREDDANLINFAKDFSIEYDNDYTPRHISIIIQDPNRRGLYCRINNITII